MWGNKKRKRKTERGWEGKRSLGREEAGRSGEVYLQSGIGPLFCCGLAPPPLLRCRVSLARLEEALPLRFFFRLDPPLTWLLLQFAVCLSPMRLGAGAAAPRANSSLCPTTINNAFFCDPLKLAKNIPPPGAGAATRVVTQSPPIEFDSFFHSVSPISRQNPSLVTTIAPSSLLVARLSIPLGLLVFSLAMNRSGMHGNGYGAPLRAGRSRAAAGRCNLSK